MLEVCEYCKVEFDCEEKRRSHVKECKRYFIINDDLQSEILKWTTEDKLKLAKYEAEIWKESRIRPLSKTLSKEFNCPSEIIEYLRLTLEYERYIQKNMNQNNEISENKESLPVATSEIKRKKSVYWSQDELMILAKAEASCKVKNIPFIVKDFTDGINRSKSAINAMRKQTRYKDILSKVLGNDQIESNVEVKAPISKEFLTKDDLEDETKSLNSDDDLFANTEVPKEKKQDSTTVNKDNPDTSISFDKFSESLNNSKYKLSNKNIITGTTTPNRQVIKSDHVKIPQSAPCKLLKTHENENEQLNDVNNIDKLFNCTFCDRAYKLKSSLSRHIKKQHNISQNSVVEETEESDMKNSSQLNGVDSVKEKILEMTTSGEYGKIHEISMNETMNNSALLPVTDKSETNFVCTVCNRGFSSQRKLDKHTLKRHVDIENNALIVDTEKVETVETYKCELCEMIFAKNKHLKKHMKKDHLESDGLDHKKRLSFDDKEDVQCKRAKLEN